jgi:rubrerythrin
MDLSSYTMKDMVLSAIKSEVDAKAVYVALAEGVKNAYLKGRLSFLAEEEEKHRDYLEGLYRRKFEGADPVLPDRTPVPLPEVRIPQERVPISTVFSQAMEAERAASEFYSAFADLLSDDQEARDVLRHFSRMEMGHYNILETEREAAITFEDYEEMWPMMHSGP